MTKHILVFSIIMAIAASPVLGQELTAVDPSVRPNGAPPAVQPQAVRGSLFRQAVAAPIPSTPNGQPAVVSTVSFTAVAEAAPRKFQKNSLITVIIREDSEASTSGKANSKKDQDFNVKLEQFLELGRFAGTLGVGNVSNPGKLPELGFGFNNDRKADAKQERKDKFTARLQAMIVDVKPNGTLVIEATKNIRVDKEEQHFTLSGICRAEDVTVDNAILSTQLADLRLTKSTRGEVRDGVKRGWLNAFIDKVNPF